MPYGGEAAKWPRRPGPHATASSRLILRAARDELAEHGYGGSTVRGIADRAGVNTSLVHYYFGSREGVLTAALREAAHLLTSGWSGAGTSRGGGGRDGRACDGRACEGRGCEGRICDGRAGGDRACGGPACDGDRVRGGAELLRRELPLWESPEWRSAVLALIRSSVTHEAAGRYLADVVRRVSPEAAGPCPHTVMLGAQLIGLMVVRHITPVEPLASADLEGLIALLAPVAERLLAGHGEAPAQQLGP
ncbi:TetR family transcriptional regulator [Streptomyces varsoviensis]|uniref:TetR/AcrR family transcriptional regulator n=1 Tax=Streptomyces varsoviensis TaxID=67373 RepID=UPI0033DC9C09